MPTPSPAPTPAYSLKGIENFVRTILKAQVKPIYSDDGDDPRCMHEFVIRGTAFLYHQVRCTMAILTLR